MYKHSTAVGIDIVCTNVNNYNFLCTKPQGKSWKIGNPMATGTHGLSACGQTEKSGISSF